MVKYCDEVCGDRRQTLRPTCIIESLEGVCRLIGMEVGQPMSLAPHVIATANERRLLCGRSIGGSPGEDDTGSAGPGESGGNRETILVAVLFCRALSISLADGLCVTHDRIKEELRATGRAADPAASCQFD